MERAEHLLKFFDSEEIVRMAESLDLDSLARGDCHLDFDEGHKVLNLYLGESVFIRPFQLYGRYGEELESTSEFQEATIYFIAKRQKLRFLLDETLFEDGFLKFAVSVSGKRIITHRISLIHLLTGKEHPEIVKPLIFSVLNSFHLKLLEVQNYPYPICGVSINKPKSDENVLVVNIYNSYGQSTEKSFLPHGLLDLAEANIDDFSEVLYIGKSRGMKKRAVTHEKVQQALAEAGDTEDIYIYFFNIKERISLWNAGEYCEKLGDYSVINSKNFGEITEVADEGRTSLVEMALINYFKPKYNSDYVNCKIPLNSQVKKILKENNYTMLMAEVNFDFDFWRFGSASVKPKQHHLFRYKL